MAQSNKGNKGNGPKNGPKDGKGATKTIAWRQQQADLNKKTKSRASKGIHEVESLPTFGITELIEGALATGHRVEINGAVFESLEAGAKLILVSANNAQLGKFVNHAQNIFVWVHDLVKEEFISPLKGAFADKQCMMWEHIVNSLEDDELAALKMRLEIQREQRRTDIAEEREQEALAQQFVGENADIWNQAVGKADIANAFDAMTVDHPAEIRITTAGQDSHYGVVLGFFFDTATNGVKIHVGHVGEKTEFMGKVTRGAYLKCFGGKLPETLAATLPSSVSLIHEMIMGMDRTVRDPIMHGMYTAVKRIVMKSAPKPKAPVLQLVPASSAPVAQPVVVEEIAPVASQPVKADPPAPAQQNDVALLVKSLRDAGYSAKEIGQAVAAYNAETNSQNQSA